MQIIACHRNYLTLSLKIKAKKMKQAVPDSGIIEERP